MAARMMKEFCAPGIAACFRAQAIVVDWSQRSRSSANDGWSVNDCFNGEIYNYKELRNTLTHYGHKFKTESDTEVILKHTASGVWMPLNILTACLP